MHAHIHSIERIELGYLLRANELRLSDNELDTNTYIEKSSIKSLVGNNIQGHTQSILLRGVKSFGTLMENKGFPSVPSLSNPFPNEGEDYFTGGYNTRRHGSQENNNTIDAIQIELNSDIRYNSVQREQLIKSLVLSINEYIHYYYKSGFLSNYYNLALNSSKNKIKFHPNPAITFFHLEMDLRGVAIIIYNSMGQKMLFDIDSNNNIKIDLLPSGYYLVQVIRENSVIDNLKLIKY